MGKRVGEGGIGYWVQTEVYRLQIPTRASIDSQSRCQYCVGCQQLSEKFTSYVLGV